MKIEVRQNKNRAFVGDIYKGVVFQRGDSYYIKVSTTEDADYNAIDLINGEPILFDNDDEVLIPSAKLIIE